MTRFNLSDWSLRHRSLVVYLMAVIAVAGLWSYFNLGREEDPPFTIKTMVVQTRWPGANTAETVEQVTDRIEKKLQEVSGLDYLKSYTKPGESVVFVNLRDTVGKAEVGEVWQEVRRKVDDVVPTLPEGIRGPYFDDEFGDTYSFIYALSSADLSHRELKDIAARLRTGFLDLADVSKVDLVGEQDERIYVEFSTARIAALGLDVAAVSDALAAQNALVPSGIVETGADRIAVRVSGGFAGEEDIASVTFLAGGRRIRLADVADVRRGLSDPAQPSFRFDGRPAVALAIAMREGGNAIALGETVRETAEGLGAELPAGVDLSIVSDQSAVVEESVHEFTKSLGEAIAIVLAVSFLALGFRPGIVVATAIPLVLAITMAAMFWLDISLQRISLGALIISLGLLVDDAMIAVETMISRTEEGHSLRDAATHAFGTTAFPMLTGTLVTIAGFLPVGFAQSGAGEYCFSLFAVVGISLVASWVVAVLFTPLTGVLVLKETHGGGHHGPGRGARAFKAVLDALLRMRWAVLAATAGLFVLSVVEFAAIPQEFFPKSDRPEVLVDLTLPRTSSIAATELAVATAEEIMGSDPGVERFSVYVGRGAVRFYLPLDAQLTNDFFAQAVVVTSDPQERQAVIDRLKAKLAAELVDATVRVTPLEMGPPVGWPLKFRVSGPDDATVRAIAQDVAEAIGRDARVRDVNFDWNEAARVVRVEVDQDRARSLGISSQQLASDIDAVLSGTTATEVRDGTYLVDVVLKAVAEERGRIETLRSLTVGTAGGARVPLEEVARLDYAMEPPLVWRRGRQPTLTVQADVAVGAAPAAVIADLGPALAEVRAGLPAGYAVAIGGATEDSAKAQASILAVFPMMALAMVTILMIQLGSVQRLAMVLLTAPLALIGVVAALRLSGAPLGFVALLGILSLAGMVIRNSVILITEIDRRIAGEADPWTAVIEATQSRLRPILLTAVAAILGMIPIAPTVFWGPMAYAVMGGLVVATALTLVVLPALYVAWFRIRPPVAENAGARTDGAGVTVGFGG